MDRELIRTPQAASVPPSLVTVLARAHLDPDVIQVLAAEHPPMHHVLVLVRQCGLLTASTTTTTHPTTSRGKGSSELMPSTGEGCQAKSGKETA